MAKSKSFELVLGVGAEVVKLRVNLRKIHYWTGRHVTGAVILQHNAASDLWEVISSGWTKLGKADAREGRYYFWAGARIAFKRAVESLTFTPEIVKAIRRSGEIEISLAENREQIEAQERVLAVLWSQRVTLARAKEAQLQPAAEPEPDVYEIDASELIPLDMLDGFVIEPMKPPAHGITPELIEAMEHAAFVPPVNYRRSTPQGESYNFPVLDTHPRTLRDEAIARAKAQDRPIAQGDGDGGVE